MSEFKRLESLILWSTPDKFWIESSKVKTTHLLQITRDESGAHISMEPHLGQIPASASKKSIYGIIGLTDLPLGQILVVVTRRANAGEVRGVHVWQMDCVEFVPVKWKRAGLCEPLEIESHQRCLALLSETLATPYFYFSYNGDITNTMQRLSEFNAVATSGKEAWERLDQRFVWNAHFLKPFLEVKANANDLHAFLTPLIHGAVFIRRVHLERKPFTWALFTRRSRFRTGTRFFVRGANAHGQVANFNETEQIVEVKGKGITSYIQTRGSMPFYWTQTPNIKYKPTPMLYGTSTDAEGAFMAHFKEQKRLYGAPQVAINLIDSRKAEGKLEEKFRMLFKKTGEEGLVYEFFDFHKECSKMRYDRLSILVDRLKKYDFGYFFVDYSGGKKTNVKRQEGAFRTNCMDCLDRTNVVQSLMSAENLTNVLKVFDILPESATSKSLQESTNFDEIFKNTWADHANMVSVQYAGTGALKTDYTRTGKRTKYGLLMDGWNSAIRYYKNNFADGFRTDGMHFFLGEIQIKDIESGIVAAKYKKEGVGSLVVNLPWLLLGAVMVAILAMIFAPNMSYKVFGTVVTSVVVAIACGKLMIQNNELFVDFPISHLKEQRQRLR